MTFNLTFGLTFRFFGFVFLAESLVLELELLYFIVFVVDLCFQFANIFLVHFKLSLRNLYKSNRVCFILPVTGPCETECPCLTRYWTTFQSSGLSRLIIVLAFRFYASIVQYLLNPDVLTTCLSAFGFHSSLFFAVHQRVRLALSSAQRTTPRVSNDEVRII